MLVLSQRAQALYRPLNKSRRWWYDYELPAVDDLPAAIDELRAGLADSGQELREVRSKGSVKYRLVKRKKSAPSDQGLLGLEGVERDA